jgi:BASS family bile acid:Na+ symporter
VLRFLAWSACNGSALLAASIFVGLAVQPLAALFRDVVTITVAGLMTLVLLRTDPAQVLAYLRRPALIAAICLWMLVATPLLAVGIARVTGLDGPLGAAFVIMATACAATSSPAFARLVGLDGEISLVVAVISTLLVPFTAPPLALGLMGIDLAISLPALMMRLMLVVGLPLLLSIALRRVLGRARLAALGPAVDGASVWLVMLYGIGVMLGVPAAAAADPLWTLGALALAFAGNFGANLATALVFTPSGQRVALAAGLLAGNRNMALFIAVLPAATDPRIILFFVLCQFPLFLSPFLLRPFYARLVRRNAAG